MRYPPRLCCAIGHSVKLGTRSIFIAAGGRKGFIGVNAMKKEMASQAEADDEILTFDVADDAVERAGSAEQTAFTLFYCTNPYYSCNVPQ
jgi:hypothetical protein